MKLDAYCSAREFFARVTYKKGVVFKVDCGRVKVYMRTDNSCGDGTIMIAIDQEFLGDQRVSVWIQILQNLVTRLENHERNEWLKLDGVRIVNPHRLP